MEKAAFDDSVHQKIGLKLREKQVKRCIQNVALYGALIRTL